jgi:hypothetical protein
MDSVSGTSIVAASDRFRGSTMIMANIQTEGEILAVIAAYLEESHSDGLRHISFRKSSPWIPFYTP